VKDASLFCPPGIEGTVVDCKISPRKGQEKDERSRLIEETQIQRLQRNLQDEIRIPHRRARQALGNLLKARSCWPTCTTKDQQAPAQQGHRS